MKPIFLIPPVLSLVIAGGLIASQKSWINQLETETVLLRERIELVRSGSAAGSNLSLATRMKEKNGVAEGEIDWEGLGGKLAQSGNGRMPDMRAMMELRTRLMELSGDELLAELAKIDALDFGKDVRRSLDGMLVGLLAQKEPKAVLDRYMDRLNDQNSGISWQLSNAFQQWQKKEPVEAMVWFDAQIANGSFDSKALDGRNDARLRFEAAAVEGLLASDPAAAKRRIEALPEDQRKQVFQQGIFSAINEDSQQAYADLVRATVPEDERGEAYSQTITMLMRGGDFEKVDGFIANIGADTAETEAIVAQAAKDRIQSLGRERKVDRAAVDEVREWAMVQSPDRADAITGESLGQVWYNKTDFEDRAKLVEQLHVDGAGDDLIISFLNETSQIRDSPDLASSLAERIGDEEKKAELLEKISGGASPPSTSERPAAVIIEN